MNPSQSARNSSFDTSSNSSMSSSIGSISPMAAYWAALNRSSSHRSGAVPPRTAVMTLVASPVPCDGTWFTCTSISGCRALNWLITFVWNGTKVPVTPQSDTAFGLLRAPEPDAQDAARNASAPAPPVAAAVRRKVRRSKALPVI